MLMRAQAEAAPGEKQTGGARWFGKDSVMVVCKARKVGRYQMDQQ